MQNTKQFVGQRCWVGGTAALARATLPSSLLCEVGPDFLPVAALLPQQLCFFFKKKESSASSLGAEFMCLKKRGGVSILGCGSQVTCLPRGHSEYFQLGGCMCWLMSLILSLPPKHPISELHRITPNYSSSAGTYCVAVGPAQSCVLSFGSRLALVNGMYL